jgi:hypothetical protein
LETGRELTWAERDTRSLSIIVVVTVIIIIAPLCTGHGHSQGGQLACFFSQILTHTTKDGVTMFNYDSCVEEILNVDKGQLIEFLKNLIKSG